MSIGHIGHVKYLLKKKSYNIKDDQILPVMKAIEMDVDTLHDILGSDFPKDSLALIETV